MLEGMWKLENKKDYLSENSLASSSANKHYYRPASAISKCKVCQKMLQKVNYMAKQLFSRPDLLSPLHKCFPRMQRLTR